MSREVTIAVLFAAVGLLVWLYSRVSWMSLGGRGAMPLWLTTMTLGAGLLVVFLASRGPLRVAAGLTIGVTLLEFPIFSLVYSGHLELEKWFFAVGNADAFAAGLCAASGYAAGAALLFVAGMFLAEAIRPAQRRPRPRRQPGGGTAWPIYVCALVGTVVSVFAMRSVVASLGGVEAIVVSMAHRREWASDASPLSYQLSLFLCIVPGWFLLRAAELRRLDGVARASTIALVLLAFAVVGLSGTRERAAFSGLSIAFALLLFPGLRGRLWREGGGRLLVPLAVMVISGLAVLSELREAFTPGADLLTGLRDFNRIDVTISGLDLMRRDQPLLLGLPFLLFPALVLERIGIGHEIVTTPQYLADQLWGIDFGGTPGAPLFLELLLNFGALGMLLLVPLGYAAGRTLQWLSCHPTATVRHFWGGAFLYLVAFKVWVQNGLSPTLVFVPVVIFEFAVLTALERRLRGRESK